MSADVEAMLARSAEQEQLWKAVEHAEWDRDSCARNIAAGIATGQDVTYLVRFYRTAVGEHAAALAAYFGREW